MKKYFALLMLLAFLCAGIISCDKMKDDIPEREEVNDDGPEPPPAPPVDTPHNGKKLSVIRHERGGSYHEYTRLEYGADKKLIRAERTKDELYTYDEEGRLKRLKIGDGGDTELYDIAWNASGQPLYSIRTKMAGERIIERDSLRYIVRNGYVTKIVVWDMLKNRSGGSWEFSYANNNLIRMEYIDPVSKERQITEFVYGNRRSPYLSCRPEFIFELAYSLKRYSVNDLVGESFTYLGRRSEWQITNSYDNDGYPILANQKNGGADNVWSYVYQ